MNVHCLTHSTFSNNENRYKIKTKEELIELLKGYKTVLTTPILEYLNSLIELEFSVIRDYINDNDRKAISNFEIYREIALYNIYNKAINLLNQNNIQFNYDDICLAGFILLDTRNISIFSFRYGQILLSGDICKYRGCKSAKIGNIHLYNTIESQEQKEMELIRILEILKQLYNHEDNLKSHHHKGEINVSRLDNSSKIKMYENMYKELDAKRTR